MDSEIERLEKQILEAYRVISGLNERFGGLEQFLCTGKEFMTEIKDSLSRIEERGKSPLVKSSSTAFSGEEEPCAWILKAEKYFKLYDIEDGLQKVAYATLFMDGKALDWLRSMGPTKTIHGWEMFKHEIVQRFGSKDRSSAYEQLQSLRQSTAVAHYREQFESMVAPIIRDFPDEVLVCAFINGLNDHVKAGIQESIKSFEDLVGVMSLAQEIENKLKMPRWSLISKKIGGGSRGKTEDNIKRLTHAEFDLMTKRNLCIRCGKIYGKIHKCRKKNLRVMVDDDEVETKRRAEEQGTVTRENQDAS